MALDPITGGEELAGKIADLVGKFIPDKEKAAEMQLEMAKLVTAEDTAQTDINKAEAGNTNWFVAGWRPAVGWICASALAEQFIFGPLVGYAGALLQHPVPLPSLDTGTLMTLLFSLLGLGTMRSVEKLQGAQGNH